MPMREVHLQRWKVAAAFTAITLAFVAGISLVRHYNNQRISDIKQLVLNIQQQRIYSCKFTYEGVRQVFEPFLPPQAKRATLPLRQRTNLAKFEDTIDRLKAGCDQQTGVKKR